MAETDDPASDKENVDASIQNEITMVKHVTLKQSKMLGKGQVRTPVKITKGQEGSQTKLKANQLESSAQSSTSKYRKTTIVLKNIETLVQFDIDLENHSDSTDLKSEISASRKKFHRSNIRVSTNHSNYPNTDASSKLARPIAESADTNASSEPADMNFPLEPGPIVQSTKAHEIKQSVCMEVSPESVNCSVTNSNSLVSGSKWQSSINSTLVTNKESDSILKSRKKLTKKTKSPLVVEPTVEIEMLLSQSTDEKKAFVKLKEKQKRLELKQKIAQKEAASNKVLEAQRLKRKEAAKARKEKLEQAKLRKQQIFMEQMKATESNSLLEKQESSPEPKKVKLSELIKPVILPPRNLRTRNVLIAPEPKKQELRPLDISFLDSDLSDNEWDREKYPAPAWSRNFNYLMQRGRETVDYEWWHDMRPATMIPCNIEKVFKKHRFKRRPRTSSAWFPNNYFEDDD